MTVMGKSAAIPLQADFVNNIVLPHFYLFAPIVYGLEALTAISLLLGIFVRLWGLVEAAQILNLWLGLYNADGEWPWTYFFLLVLQPIFALYHYGSNLGVDAIIARAYDCSRQARQDHPRRRNLTWSCGARNGPRGDRTSVDSRLWLGVPIVSRA
jgi:hypothetical protein